ncbi:MAG: hypothetical protein U1F11_05895 [Steroidobacteraceae bacterium]
MKTKPRTAALLAALATIVMPLTTTAAEPAKPAFTYATYFKCDVTLQERADEIIQQLDQPAWEAAIAEGSAKGWGWMAHNTGGNWRRAEYFRGSSIEGMLALQKKIGDQVSAKNKKADTEFGKICNSHDDYIWRMVAGKNNDAQRGGASFSTYFVCDVNREEEADSIVRLVNAPVLDRFVAEGKIKSWGWQEHIVGGQYRRLQTITAADVASLVSARAAIVEALDKEPLTRTLDGICGSHTDYIWEIKAEKN